MEQTSSNNPENVPLPSADFDDVRNGAAGFRNVPHLTESFRKVPNDSESIGSFPNGAERKENHTLTVREAARMFEAAKVARTERSIVNWCQPNKSGIPRLDSYFDPNERKYFITRQSIESAIAEEQAKAAKSAEPSEPVGTVLKDAERPSGQSADSGERGRVKELELQVRDLEITNRVKDQVIGMKDQQIGQLQQEHRDYIERLIDSGHRIGELETKLLQLEGPSAEKAEFRTKLKVTSLE